MLPLPLSLLLLLLGEATDASSRQSTQNRLVNTILESYDKKVKPTILAEDAVVVSFSMELYQIIEVNEPQQFVLINAWIAEVFFLFYKGRQLIPMLDCGQRWRDELLYWDPADYDGIEEIRLPYDVIWLPDTTLYNTLVMNAEETIRLMNARLLTNTTDQYVYVELLYPTIYRFSCHLNIFYFPYDIQICNMTFGSWTYDNSGIDYVPFADNVGTSNYLENQGWSVLSFTAARRELKYACCPNNYTNLDFTLHIKRKPLFYLVNLIIPTCIITLISIIGFFTPSAANGERNEKITLGITTLLSMSILLLMISDKMPTTSTFVPLMGWFLLSMIIVISLSTIMSTVVIMVQKLGLQGERLPKRTVRITYRLSRLIFITIPNHLSSLDLSSRKYRAYLNAVRNKKRQRGSSQIELIRRSASPFMPSKFETVTPLLPNINNNGDTPKSVESGDAVSAPRAFKAAVMKQQKTAAESENKTRILAVREYEWLATVVERCSFVVFFILFILLSIGINGIGLMQWLRS